MFSLTLVHLYWALLLLLVIPVVRGELYVTEPQEGQVCHGGKPCTVAWLDDGTSPSLTSIGPCTIGLYAGQELLVQQIEPVDVSRVHGFTFTPNAKAGPNSDTYYIAFTSVSLKSNGSEPYVEFSPTFTLNDMYGSFDSPLPSATSSIAIPSSVASPPPNTIVTTTVGQHSTASPFASATPSASSLSPSPSASGFTRIPSSSVTIASPTASPSTSATPNRTNAGHRATSHLATLTFALGLSLFSIIYHY